MKKIIKTINADGSIAEVEVSFEVWKFDKDDFWQIDWQERKHKQELSLEELGQVSGGRDIYDLALISNSAEFECFNKFSSETLHKAMYKLSEKQRRRIFLKFFRGLTFEEIAKIENSSESSMKSAIYLGLQNLKKILESL